MKIVKASGETQTFDRDKLCRSLQRVGAPPEVVQKVCGLIEGDVHEHTTTAQIAQQAEKYLQQEDFLLGAKYRLKKGIMELGPAGFLFEEYVAAILQEYGYAAEVGGIIQGKCLKHEIDIRVEHDNKHYLAELKYHNRRGIKTDAKVIMYMYARFLDIAATHSEFEDENHAPWVITNTRFTRNAITYGNCMGVELLSWDYPKEESLERLIVQKSLYPVTVLPSATPFVREQLAQHHIMFVRDILHFSAEDVQKKFGIRAAEAKTIVEEAYRLV